MEPQVKFKGGGSFVAKAPQFSADGQTIFVVWRNSIVSYNTKTAKRLREYIGCKDPIADFQIHMLNGYEHVTACTILGEVSSWKVVLGLRVLKTQLSGDGNLHVESFQLLECGGEKSIKFLVTRSVDNKHQEVGIFDLATWTFRGLKSVRLSKKSHLAVSSGYRPYFAVVYGRKLLFVRFQNERPQIYRHSIDRGRKFTCVAVHPEEECVLTGDNTGRVLVWYNLASTLATQAVYHWHTLAVNCVSFSSSGNNFYSGAGECVLVKWYFDNPHYKDFLPRLPSAIKHIGVSSDNQLISVATDDNGIRVLDPRFDTVSIIQHLVLGSHFPAGIIYDQRTKTMVLNGLVGHVQFYSPHDMALLYNLDVVGQNKLTQERGCHIENTNVQKIAISNSGLWLAIVEERVDISYSFELRLKFFLFNVVKQIFELNTSVEFPHEKSITQLLFQPGAEENLRCVTIANDKKFKIWELTNADTIYHKSNAWKCSRIGFYRNSPCNTMSFSPDGSILAVGFGTTVTAWTPDTCELKCSLLHPTQKQDLKTLQFGTANQCHLVVAGTSGQLSVWNLLSLTMIWTVNILVSKLVASPLCLHMALFTSDGKLFVFYPNSSQPVFTRTMSKGEQNVVAAVFIPNLSKSDSVKHWYQGSDLYFLTSKQELFCLNAEEDQDTVMDTLSEEINNSLFTWLIPKTKSRSVKKAGPVHHLTDISCKNKQLEQLLHAPVHTMVPIRLTCGSILRSFVQEYQPKQNVT